MTCFLIEDDQDDQEVFGMALRTVNASSTIVYAFDGVEALEKLRNSGLQDVDFIFLDLNMPRMNGKQFLVEVKRDPSLKHIPVIIYSTSSDANDKEETKSLGAFEFMTKPPYLVSLLNCCATFFQSKATI